MCACIHAYVQCVWVWVGACVCDDDVCVCVCSVKLYECDFFLPRLYTVYAYFSFGVDSAECLRVVLFWKCFLYLLNYVHLVLSVCIVLHAIFLCIIIHM